MNSEPNKTPSSSPKFAGFGACLNDVFGDEKYGKCQCGRNLTSSGWCHRCSKFTRSVEK